MATNRVVIFSGQTSDASSTPAVVDFRGRRGMLVLDGGFGGGTFTLTMKSPVSANYVALNDEQGNAISKTAACSIEMNMIPYGATIKGTLAGSSAASLNATLLEVNTGR